MNYIKNFCVFENLDAIDIENLKDDLMDICLVELEDKNVSYEIQMSGKYKIFY